MSHVGPTGALLPYGRWASLSALLAAEVLALTIRFDSPSLGGNQGIFRFAYNNGLIHLAGGVAITASVLVAIGLHDRLRGLAGELRQNVWPPLLGHLGA